MAYSINSIKVFNISRNSAVYEASLSGNILDYAPVGYPKTQIYQQEGNYGNFTPVTVITEKYENLTYDYEVYFNNEYIGNSTANLTTSKSDLLSGQSHTAQFKLDVYRNYTLYSNPSFGQKQVIYETYGWQWDPELQGPSWGPMLDSKWVNDYSQVTYNLIQNITKEHVDTIYSPQAIYYTAPGMNGASIGGAADYHFKSSGSPQSGEKWEVSAGIKSLLNYFDIFPSYANAYLTWKAQSLINNNYNFGDSQNRLSAEGLNSVYSTLGAQTNYKTGDAVSAAMFTGLENIVNNINISPLPSVTA